jgi:hypothetical protein
MSVGDRGVPPHGKEYFTNDMYSTYHWWDVWFELGPGGAPRVEAARARAVVGPNTDTVARQRADGLLCDLG